MLLFLLFLGTRLYRLGETPIYPDEITWMVRGKETALAIKTKDLDFFKSAWWTTKTDTEAIAIPLTAISGFPIIYLGKGQSVLSRNVLQDYIAGRGSVIIFSAVFVILYYFLIQKFLGGKIAFLSALFLTLDPIFVANSKLIMNDIFLTVFIFISVASYLFVKEKTLSILFSSMAAAAAFLTKPNGLVVFAVFLFQALIYREKWKEELGKFFTASALTAVFISLVWPASWSNLLFAIPEYIFRQGGLVGAGINNYFMGKLTENPPFYYYLFELLTRLPPLIIAGFAASLAVLFFGKDRNRKSFISIFFFLLCFLLVISLSPKKLGVRYALPLWPWIYAVSLYGMSFIIEKIKPAVFKSISYILVAAWFVGVFVYFFPYHDLYYNFTVGGAAGSGRYDMVGLCTGSKAAADYILECYPQVRSIGALGCGSSTIPYYYPYSYTSDWKDKKVFYVEAYYLQLAKDREVLDYVDANPASYIVSRNGLNLAYVYVKEGTEKMCK